jgi:hexosaminidase
MLTTAVPCLAVGLVLTAVGLPLGAGEPPPLVPLAVEASLGAGVLALGTALPVWWDGAHDPLLERAAERLARRLAVETGIPVRAERTPSSEQAVLRIHAPAADPGFLTLDADESYSLEVSPRGADLWSPGTAGVLRGLATLAQLVSPTADGYGLRAASVRDRPRFAWRGLMMDVSRHFVPIEALERQLELMEAVKLNVLHLHLTDDEGFRLESRVHPRLHGEGSAGEYYTQDEVRTLVARARDRGIRVVPEIDVPAHTKSWLVGYPELATRPGPYRLGPDAAVRSALLDPTREEVYAFVDSLIGEVTGLFPDAFLHVGGDEVASPEWDASLTIQAFMKAHGIADRRALHAHFSRRVEAIVAAHGRTMIGWDEVLGHELPGSAVVQTWRSSKLVARATAAGRRTVVSGGYYLDWAMPSAFHYAVDPVDPRAYGLTAREAESLKGTPLAAYVGEANVLDETASLTPEQERLVLGGEAAMWTEMVTAEMLDGRLWPRTAAVAERLWSPRQVRDADAMERRLLVVGGGLERLGSRHEADPRLMVERMAPGDPDPLLALWSAVEPARFYSRLLKRMMGGPAAQLAPFNCMADAAVPESVEAVRFRLDVQDLIASKETTGPRVDRVRARLTAWRSARAGIESLGDRAPGAAELLPVADDLEVLAMGGLAALDAWQRGAPVDAAAVTAALDVAERHAAAQAIGQVASLKRPPPPAEVDLAIAPSVRALIRAAGSPAGSRVGPGSAPSP